MKYRILLLIRINARNQIELNPARIRYNFFLVENNNFVTVVYRLLKSVARYNCGSIFNLYTPEWQPPLKNLLNKLELLLFIEQGTKNWKFSFWKKKLFMLHIIVQSEIDFHDEREFQLKNEIHIWIYKLNLFIRI